jgi:hypothetical protein
LRVCTQLVFMKLLGTGVLAAISGMRATNADAAMSCAYATAVNAVACCHYYVICKRLRNQTLTHPC